MTIIHSIDRPQPRPRAEVRLAAPEDHAAVTAVLAAAFADDPVLQWMLPDESTRPEALLTTFGAFTDAIGRHQEIRITADAAGTALWLPPGTHVVDESNAAAFQARVGDIVGIAVERVGELNEKMDAAHPTEPHWYLNLLGVVPERQGQGLGGALLAPVLAVCDSGGVGAYLEATTERNRALYARNGFEVTDSIELSDGPTLWPMWREPAS